MFVTTAHVDYEGSRVIGIAETFEAAYKLFWDNIRNEAFEHVDEFRVTKFEVGEVYLEAKPHEIKWRRDGKS